MQTGNNLRAACTAMLGDDVALVYTAMCVCDDMMWHAREYTQRTDTDIPIIIVI